MPDFTLKLDFSIKLIKIQKKAKKRKAKVDQLKFVMYNIKLYPYRIDRIRKDSIMIYLSLLYNENRSFTS